MTNILDFAEEPDQSTTSKIGELAQAVVESMQEVDQLEEELKKAQAMLRKLRDNELSKLMEESGLKEVTLSNGYKVILKDVFVSNIPSVSALAKIKDQDELAEAIKRRNAALDFMKEVAPVYVKQTCIVNFGKGQNEHVEEYLKRCADMGVTPEVSETVHASSLRNWLKNNMSDLTEDQKDLLGAKRIIKAEIKKNGK